MTKKREKKRNPNDATFRNIRPLKVRVADLEAKVAKLMKLHKDCFKMEHCRKAVRGRR